MKPKLTFNLLTGLVILLAGCATYEPQAKPGIYRSSSTADFIILSTNKMLIHIEGMDSRDKTGEGLMFDYYEWPNGRLFPSISRSAEFFYGYPSIDYQWEGGIILATNCRSKAKSMTITNWVFIKSDK